jgi:rubrerythrin
MGRGEHTVPKDATARIEEIERKMQEPPSAEEMEHRKKIAKMLLAKMNRPVSDEEKEFWREFQADLERDRPKFR